MRDKSGKGEEVEHSSGRFEFLLLFCSLISCVILPTLLSDVNPLNFVTLR